MWKLLIKLDDMQILAREPQNDKERRVSKNLGAGKGPCIN
jgi:hypothetical protein